MTEKKKAGLGGIIFGLICTLLLVSLIVGVIRIDHFDTFTAGCEAGIKMVFSRAPIPSPVELDAQIEKACKFIYIRGR